MDGLSCSQVVTSTFLLPLAFTSSAGTRGILMMSSGATFPPAPSVSITRVTLRRTCVPALRS
eukprot:9047426-Alexandrium_andersonii.AAC.1